MVAESEVITSLLSDFGRGPWARGGRKLSLFRQCEAFPGGQQFWRRIAAGSRRPQEKGPERQMRSGPDFEELSVCRQTDKAGFSLAVALACANRSRWISE
jgi:hypothetical protein